VLKFMEKPVNLTVIASMAQSLYERFRNPTGRGDTSFFASLSRLSPLDIIQLKCLNKATQAVDFVSKLHGSGRVYFRDGEIIHAQTEVAAGENALREIVSWRGGRVVEVSDSGQPARSINASWQSLLLEAAHAMDEKKSAADGE
jgi:hypothetical protein